MPRLTLTRCVFVFVVCTSYLVAYSVWYRMQFTYFESASFTNNLAASPHQSHTKRIDASNTLIEVENSLLQPFLEKKDTNVQLNTKDKHQSNQVDDTLTVPDANQVDDTLRFPERLTNSLPIVHEKDNPLASLDKEKDTIAIPGDSDNTMQDSDTVEDTLQPPNTSGNSESMLDDDNNTVQELDTVKDSQLIPDTLENTVHTPYTLIKSDPILNDTLQESHPLKYSQLIHNRNEDTLMHPDTMTDRITIQKQKDNSSQQPHFSKDKIPIQKQKESILHHPDTLNDKIRMLNQKEKTSQASYTAKVNVTVKTNDKVLRYNPHNSPIVAEYIANLPTHSDHSSLYPSLDNPWDNRVFKQLTYIPQNITGIKKIYAHFRAFSPRIPSNSRQPFIDWRCHVNQCTLTTQHTATDSDIINADIVLFEQSLLNYKPARRVLKIFKTKRRREQIWALVTGESGTRTVDPFRGRSYNWTVSMSPWSPLHINFGSAFQIDQNVPTMPLTRNWASFKTRKVVMITSLCRTYNNRLEYQKELAKYIDIDVFGKCGKRFPNCTHTHFDCTRDMVPKYKFYLSFENDNCETYVTEKSFINGMKPHAVPVIMGAPKAYVTHILPTNSFIHVEDFSSAKHLAAYLHKLDQNDHLYNEYFRWKGAWAIREHDDEIFMAFDDIPPYNVYCRICALLHAPPRTDVTTLKEWKRSERCRKPLTP